MSSVLYKILPTFISDKTKIPLWTHIKIIENINEQFERTIKIRKYLYDFSSPFVFKVFPAFIFVHM